MVHGKDTEMMVSVIVITYGHEKYIEEAINGVFIQQTDFPVELIIANDCSPDQTDEVVKLLLSRAPENITVRYTKHQTNKGMNANFLWAASQATGKYIALCEGDDYWTDPLKLQKQVDFLEENEDYVLVCTNADNTSQFDADKEIGVFDILHHNPVRTLTAMFKSSTLHGFVGEERMMGDLQLWIYIARQGKIKFVSDVTAYYRILSNSASGRNDIDKKINFLQDRILVTKQFINELGFTKSQKKKILQDQYSWLISTCLKKNKTMAFKFYMESLWTSKMINGLDLKLLKNFW